MPAVDGLMGKQGTRRLEEPRGVGFGVKRRQEAGVWEPGGVRVFHRPVHWT